MNKDWIKLQNKLSVEYREGVSQFLEVAKLHVNDSGRTRCPCKKCMNSMWESLEGVERHLLTVGISPSYVNWIYHGERVNLPRGLERVATHLHHDDEGTSNLFEQNEMLDLLNDLQVPIENEEETEEAFENEMPFDDDQQDTTSLFEDLMNEARNELYPGCSKFSSLNFLVKLMRIKVLNGWSNKSFDMLLKMLKAAFPAGTIIPTSFFEAKRKLHDLGLGYESIHACKYDCILYWKEFGDLQHCPICGESRYKVNDDKRKKIPHKVLHHFPLIPRLKRLFASEEGAFDMRWHKNNRVETDDVLRHPADAEGWKHFDREFPEFASDSRNVRLGLASGGFNPFGNMSTSYSMWPVVIIPYNLPPWKCMKESNFFMSLLIPGPRSPGKEIDVYLQPLIEELKQLWTIGVRTYDSLTGEFFQLYATLLWTFNDFPAYGDLSGWSIKGYRACPTCMEDKSSFKIRGKISFMGHRRFLPKNHIWRKSKQHDGKVECRSPPVVINGDDILQQLDSLNFPVLSKHPLKQDKKRKRALNWTKRSIFFELPYWSRLLLRHKLDVIHIEKNVCDNLVGTLLNIEEKTKDTTNARLDLQDLKIRKELHLREVGNRFVKPHATYTLTNSERIAFCKFLKSVKFPDGFISNISQCVNDNDGKIAGLKTHDCHVLLHRLLPIGVRAYLPKNVSIAVTELCGFFRDLCAKTMRISDLNRLQSDIIVILCKLERIFPPAFFDVIIHLAVHLPYETKVVGPISYSSMYPIERSLRTLKQFVRNKARPEGSIAEAYVMKELKNFCYLSGIETRFNRDDRNDDNIMDDEVFGEFEVFRQSVQPLGASTLRTLSPEEKQQVHWYILNNCKEITDYRKQHLRLIRHQAQTALDLYRRHERAFPDWFRAEVLQMRERENLFDDLFSVAMGPSSKVRSYSGCIVNGVRFHTVEHDSRRTTQNNGVMIVNKNSGDGSTDNNFYGVVDEVLDFQYVFRRRVWAFKCRWFDTDNKKSNRTRVELGCKSINTSHFWFVDELFILADEAQQVFYLDDPKYGTSWKVIQMVQNKHTSDVLEVEDVENEQLDVLEIVVGHHVDEHIEDDTLCRVDVDPTMVERSVVQHLVDNFINDDDEQLSPQNRSSDGES
ncbi:hypothetical protein IC582_003922 [Cucumis melo]|nr:uncharacterized protein LOC103487435 isoform X1 [Cucumis melo]